MTKKQRKLIEVWFVLLGLIAFLSIASANSWNGRWAFVPVIIYALANWKTITEFERLAESPIETIKMNKAMGIWAIAVGGVIIAGSFAALYQGVDLGEHIGFAELFGIVLLPILPALLWEQVQLYRRLGHVF